MRRTLTIGNPKTMKGEAAGYKTAVLHLAPADLSGTNVCPWATAGCKAACLNTAGRGGIMRKGETTNAIQQARLRRTRDYVEDRQGFLTRLHDEVAAFVRSARKAGLIPAVRLNGTSDLDLSGFVEQFPDVQFYDYTKSPQRIKRYVTGQLPPNYHLTYSLTERDESWTTAQAALADGVNVAVVFDKVPAKFMGYDVIDGDAHDLRFLDRQGVIVGLKAKGKAKRDTTGFVKRLAA